MGRTKDIHMILGMWGPEIKAELLEYIKQESFYPNVCGFCFKQQEETDDARLWLLCKSCKIVSYCSENHMLKHQSIHKDFDRVVAKLLSESPTKVDYFYEFMDLVKSPVQKPLLLMSFIDGVSSKLLESRGIFRAEGEMIKFFPHCEACSEVNPNQLTKCDDCLVNFCSKHQNDPEALMNHKEFCSAYLQSFILEAYGIAFDDVDLIEPIIKSTNLLREKSSFPVSMYEFLETQIDFYQIFETLEHPYHYEMSTDFKVEENLSDIRAFVSAHLSKPLSLIFAIKALGSIPSEETIIHVIGATAEEIKGLNQWELFLQWFQGLKKVTIVFVGNELELSDPEENFEETSVTYASWETQLVFQFSNCLYKTYYENSKNFQEPNFIIAYNPGLSVYDDWDESLLVLTNFKCPFIFTSYYKEDALLDHDKMKIIFGEEIDYYLFNSNPYKSLRPLRFYGDSYPLVYKNNYITIYKTCVPEERD